MKKQLLILFLAVSSSVFGATLENLTEKQKLLQEMITEQEAYIAQSKRELKAAQDNHLRPEVIAVQHDVILTLEDSLQKLRNLQVKNLKKISNITPVK